MISNSMSVFFIIFQINGVDMTSAHHDAAVQHLTDHQRFVRLVVQREIKGPLEPPQSPRSPMLKNFSPSGYQSNRSTGYKRSSDGSSPIEDNHHKYMAQNIISHGVQPHQLTGSGDGGAAATVLSTNIPKTNGIENSSVAPQPVPAPRRLASQNSMNGSVSQNGNKSEDDEAQVSDVDE